MQTKTDLLKLVKSIGARGKALDRDIQTAAIGAIYYSVCYGDVTIGQKLLEAFNAGQRKNSLVAFLEMFGQFAWNAGTKSLDYRKNTETEIKFAIEGEEPRTLKFADLLENVADSEAYAEGIKMHWSMAKPEPEIVSKYDLLDETRKFLRRMEKEIASGKAVNTHVFDAVAAAVAELDKVEEEEEEVQQAAA